MYKIRKDVRKNRLYITLSGIFPLSDAKNAKDEIIKEINELKPNFDVINDISEFIRGQDEAGKILQDIMLLLIDKKVNRIARVVGTSKTGLIQFANYSLKIESYKLKYLPTLREAEKFLDSKEDR
ncbi:MAG: hypothetical protein WCA84_03800 [Ignavibacteriaceae bacterium]|jgi:hypothetical protein